MSPLLYFLSLCFLLIILSYGTGGLASYAAALSLLNGIRFKDMLGNPVQAHGGGMIKSGGSYFWVGENRDGTNYVSLYSSTDLKNWQFCSNILSKSSAPELEMANIERPKLLYNAETRKYVLWVHKENGVNYGEARIAVAWATNIVGPYTYQGSFRPLGFDSRDMTVFNDNGTAYLISATRVNADLNIYRLTQDFLGVESLVQTLWTGAYREAPAMFKRGETYFLITSGATGWSPNQQKYATASSISGIWSALCNVGDSRSFESQSAYVIAVEGTSFTSYMYMGDRWAGAWEGPPNESKYVWLPLSFPTSTSLSMSWFPKLSIDIEEGKVEGIPFSVHDSILYELINRKSEKLLKIRDGVTTNGADTEQSTDKSLLSQRWNVINAGNGYYKLKNVKSELVLGPENGALTDGTVIEQWSDGGWTSQHWQLIDAGGGFFKLQNCATGKLIQVSSSALTDGANVIQWTDTNGMNQQWQIVETNN